MSQTPNYIVSPKLPGKYQKPITNLIGKTFGFLEVIEIERTEEVAQTRWFCRCVCGKEKSILGTHLRRGLINSCGCKKGEFISKAKQTDLKGRVYGRWTVIDGPIRSVTRAGSQILWDCKCTCGEAGRIYAGHLVGGKSRSCGCLCIELTKIANTTHGGTAGPIREVEYTIWAGMHARCRNHPDYAGRGIRVCNGMCNYRSFVGIVGRRPSAELSIDRIDNNRHYSCGQCEECVSSGWPMNCRWGTDEIQQNNKRNNVRMTLHDKTMTAAQWARELHLDVEVIYHRKKAGWSDEDALLKPLRVWPSKRS